MTSSGSETKKNLHEREIIDFLYAMEDRLREDDSKIRKFMEIINQEGNVK